MMMTRDGIDPPKGQMVQPTQSEKQSQPAHHDGDWYRGRDAENHVADPLDLRVVRVCSTQKSDTNRRQWCAFCPIVSHALSRPTKRERNRVRGWALTVFAVGALHDDEELERVATPGLDLPLETRHLLLLVTTNASHASDSHQTTHLHCRMGNRQQLRVARVKEREITSERKFDGTASTICNMPHMRGVARIDHTRRRFRRVIARTQHGSAELTTGLLHRIPFSSQHLRVSAMKVSMACSLKLRGSLHTPYFIGQFARTTTLHLTHTTQH